ncbi:MAG: DciA family protein [Ottowia sp.]|nr:DUF721 domain-containing protein [Ottowia sp.]
MTHSTRRAMDIEQAVAQAPILRQLAERARASAERLALVRPLLPPGLQDQVLAGALEDGIWCLLVPHHAAAAKLRQLQPLILDALQQAGHPMERIRIKISKRG